MWVNDTITICKKEIPVCNGSLPVQDLQFYPDNPRIYSLIQKLDFIPSQDEILNRLKKMDHVKQLIQSIRANGGLTDPMLVRNGDLVVLEGNSRLAAYRELARNDPITWGEAKVRLLPPDIPDELVFALLGEYHIIGRKDWAPYEQAGYLYRRNISHKISAERIADDMGLSRSKVNHLITTYKFMLEHNETDVARWSYYDEYLKSRPAKKARSKTPTLDETVVRKIKSGEISAAVEVRDKLAKLLDTEKVGQEPIKIFLSGDDTFQRAFASAQDRGVDNMWLNRFTRFRRYLTDDTFDADWDDMSSDQKRKCLFQLKKIEERIKRVRKNNQS